MNASELTIELDAHGRLVKWACGEDLVSEKTEAREDPDREEVKAVAKVLLFRAANDPCGHVPFRFTVAKCVLCATGGDGSFGFEILNAEGEVIAMSPAGYSTPAEANAALNRATLALCEARLGNRI
jgi:hypothetical protein